MNYRDIRRIPQRISLLCGIVALGLLAMPPGGSAAPPGIPGPPAGLPLEAFLVSAPKTGYTLGSRPPALLKNRRQFIQPGVHLLDAETRTLFVYREAGGERVGLPAVISLDELSAYKSRNDRHRIIASKLGKEVQVRPGEGSGLVNIKIPVKVPRGLSAITGEGESNIRITGSRRIEFSGLSQYTVGQAQTATTRTSKFPTINFEQESRLSVQGTIGDRISIELEQDSRGQLDLGESLRLRYDGDEDGIIQEIEAGNTTLSLSGTRLTGFSAQSRGGLFGIKAKGKLGGMDLTVVTSQDKGSSNRKTFQGQAEEIANQTRDFQYMENVYFFLDRVYRDAFPGQPEGGNLVDINTVRVFVNDFNDINDIEQSANPGIAFAYWMEGGTPDVSASRSQNGGVEEGSFHELEREEFFADARGYLIMRNSRISEGFALAVAYRTVDGRTFGDLAFIPDPTDPNSRINLKLIKARNQRPDYPTWDLAWRNVYSLGGRDIDPEGFDLRIFKEVPGQEPLDNQGGDPYLKIFDLDTHTNGAARSTPPDNIIDTDTGNEIPGLNLALGHLVFPFLEPFGDEGVGAPGLEDRVPDIYTTINATTRNEKSKYFLTIRSKSRATQFNLGFGGIIENSEVVRLNNRVLTRGKDYTLDYQFGQVRFIGEAADLVADPSADLTIDYGSKDIFGFGQQKSLLGIRAEHPFSDNYSLVGMTLLYSSQSTPSQRVRVGQEPARTIIWDTNARFRFRPQALTNMVNAMPFVTTQAPSSLNIDAEIAQSIPNPNTKGVAYIDDFEGTQSSLSFSTSKLAWVHASTPTLDGTPILRPKGRLTWYNPVEGDRISIYNIQPNRDDIPLEQSIVDILVARFDPHRTSGFPERTSDMQRGFPERSWAGVMRYLDGFDLSRTKYIEMWVRGNAGRLHIDLGEISERIDLPLDHPVHNPPDAFKFRTEDEPLGAGLPGDNIATEDEDIGLDGLDNEAEADIYRKIYGVDPPSGFDPSGDDFSDVDLKRTDVRSRYPPGVNGTQKNGRERNSLPDTEDLNRNGILDTRNNHVRYSFDLGTNRGFSPGIDALDGPFTGPSVLVEGSQSDATDNPWRLIRIPLQGKNAPRTEEGSPDATFASAIDFVRLWIENDDTTTVQVYTFDAVGSDWQEDLVPPTQRSGDFAVASIGTDNPIYAQEEPPPGLDRETDPTTGLKLQERSLALQFVDLYPGERISVSRTFLQGENYTQYGTISMFVHGGNPAVPGVSDRNFPAVEDTLGGGANSVEVFVRFSPISGDTLNFYEYRAPVYRGWAPDVNTIHIDLELLSQLKGQLLDLRAGRQASSDTLTLSLKTGDHRVRYNNEGNRIDLDLAGRTYTVHGNPALDKIKAFTIGVHNRSDRPLPEGKTMWLPDGENQTLAGENEVWFDELRVDNIRKKRALSAILDLQTVLADLGNLSISLERRSGDFQDMRGQASGNTTTRIVLNSDINLNKFLPDTWNASIPIRFSYNRFSSVPRIRPGSDIVLTSAQKAEESDTRSQSRLNISFTKRPAQKAPRILSRVLFDRMRASLNYASDSSENGAITQRRVNAGSNVNGNFSYDLNWAKQGSVRPLGWFPAFKPLKELEFFLLPSSVRYNVRFNRILRDQRSFSAVGDTSGVLETQNETFTLNENFSVKLAPFKSLTADYDLSFDRDMRNGFAFTQLQFGRETGRTQNASLRYSPRLSRWFTVNMQYSASYRENLETGGQRDARGYGNTRRGLTANSQNNASARFSINLPALFQPLTRPSKGEKPGGFSFVRLIGHMGTSLQNIQATASRSKRFGFFGLKGRPSFKYQLGLTDTIFVDRYGGGGVTRTDTRGVQDRATVGSGLRLPGGLNIQTSMDYNLSRSVGNARTEEDRLSLPNLDASWRGLERLPILRWFLTSSSVNSSYQKSHSRRGEGGLDARAPTLLDTLHITSDARETAYNPIISWTARWKGQMNTTVRNTRSRQLAVRYQRNVSTDDTSATSLGKRLIGTTINDQSSFQGTLRYTLGSKLFKKLQSNIDLDLSYARSASQQKEFPRSVSLVDSVAVVRRDDNTWSAGLGAQYQFSRKFTGGAKFRHESRKDLLRDLTNKIWEFRLWGEIRFN